MKHLLSRRVSHIILAALIILVSLPLAACTGTQSSPTVLDAGPNDMNISGAQFSQYNFYRFDTAATGHTLTLPSAVDLVSAFSGATNGVFTVFIVAADGNNPVNIAAGAGVTVKPSAAAIPGNHTQTLCCVFTGVSSGSESVSIY